MVSQGPMAPLYGACITCGRSDARVLSPISRIGICPVCGNCRVTVSLPEADSKAAQDHRSATGEPLHA